MSLFKQYSGNVYNENTQLISNFRFRGYHRQQNKWSDWYPSNGLTQYNINLGDAAFLSQDGAVIINDTILIIVETTEANPLERRFAMIETSVTSIDVRIIDVQLRPITPPIVENRWKLTSPTDGDGKVTINSISMHRGRINENITASNTFTDEKSWSFNGNIMFQVITRYNQQIFSDRVGISKVEYDWKNDGVYVDNNIHVFNTPSVVAPGYYTVKAKATNHKHMDAVGILYIRIMFNAPVPNITWTPTNPLAGQPITFTNTTVDIDSTVTNIDYYFDNDMLTSNDDISHSWVQPLGSIFKPQRTVKTVTTWNDGFDNHIIELERIIVMTNMPPLFELRKEEVYIGNILHNKVFIINIDDPDGDNNKVNFKWRIEYQTPIDNEFKIVYNEDYPTTIDQSEKVWLLDRVGIFRIVVTGRDEYDLESTRSMEVEVTTEETVEVASAHARWIEWE